MIKALLRAWHLIRGSITHPRCVYFCKGGLWLWYKGDEVLWCWTWRQYQPLFLPKTVDDTFKDAAQYVGAGKDGILLNAIINIDCSEIMKYCWVSLLASGNGEFGDAGFDSLKAMDEFWDEYNRITSRVGSL